MLASLIFTPLLVFCRALCADGENGCTFAYDASLTPAVSSVTCAEDPSRPGAAACLEAPAGGSAAAPALVRVTHGNTLLIVGTKMVGDSQMVKLGEGTPPRAHRQPP